MRSTVEIKQTIVGSEMLSRKGMIGADEGTAVRIVGHRESVEDATAVTIEKKDMEVLRQMIVPKSILVIKERKVARNEIVGTIGRGNSIAHCSADTTLNAVDASVAAHCDGVVERIALGITHCTAISKM